MWLKGVLVFVDAWNSLQSLDRFDTHCLHNGSFGRETRSCDNMHYSWYKVLYEYAQALHSTFEAPLKKNLLLPPKYTYLA